MDDRQALRAAGERDVERAQALLLAGDDGGRLDHDHAVELEALDDADRHDGDARRSSPLRVARPCSMPARSARRTPRRPSRRGRRRRCCRRRRRRPSPAWPRPPASNSSLRIVDVHELGVLVADAHADRRTQRRRRRHHHPVGQLHDLLGDAVADAEARSPATALLVGQVLRARRPSRRAPARRWPGRCRRPRSCCRSANGATPSAAASA